MEIDGDRLIRDLRALAEIGTCGTGVDRIAFSPADVAARSWVAERLAEIGLDVTTDGYGTVLGRWPGVARAVLIGSHTDTVPRGGWLDGALGVVYGIAIARALAASGQRPAIGVDVIDFQDEEGSYLSLLGSRSFCGTLDPAEIDRARAQDGTPLTEALARAGFAGAPVRLDRSRHVAFLEAHIEQGPQLEAAAIPTGVVSGFVGIRRFVITAEGRADHAGTTPMGMRRNAGLPIFRLATWIEDAFAAAAGPATVWNIGHVALAPGATNVVPASGSLSVEMRCLEADRLDRMEAMLREQVATIAAATAMPVAIERTAVTPPVMTDPGIAATLTHAAADLQLRSMRLHSGAGHDCMILAEHLPVGMLFVPSIGGRSHDVSEDTAEADIVAGARVLARAVERLIAAPPAAP